MKVFIICFFQKQFKFLHGCLLEVYLAGDTSISVEKLTTFDVNNEGEKLGKQFKVCLEKDTHSLAVRKYLENRN